MFIGGVDRASSQGITVSTWDTEEHLLFSRDVLGDLPSRFQASAYRRTAEVFEVTTPTCTRVVAALAACVARGVAA